MKINFKFNEEVVCKRYNNQFSVILVNPFSVKGVIEILNKCLINNVLLSI
jgi:hypothetical protein